VEDGSKVFQIRVVGGLSLAIPILKGPQGDGYTFQIIDVQQRMMGFYQYSGLAIALPSPPGLPISFTGVGPLKTFKTSEPVRLTDFQGHAHLYQDPGSTVGPVSLFGTLRLSFESKNLLRAHARVIPSIVPIDGGPGLQTPSFGSAPVSGVLSLYGRIIPFKG
jgi:hypothetical protein